MKYYSRRVFLCSIIVNIIFLVIVLYISYLSSQLIGLAGPIGTESVKKFNEQLSISNFLVILFFVFSTASLFLQQYKNYRWGYLSIISIFLDLYVIRIIYIPSVVLYQDLISFSFSNLKQLNLNLYFSFEGFGELIIWGVWLILFFIVVAIPFYVLIKLVKEDFFKK